MVLGRRMIEWFRKLFCFHNWDSGIFYADGSIRYVCLSCGSVYWEG